MRVGIERQVGGRKEGENLSNKGGRGERGKKIKMRV